MHSQGLITSKCNEVLDSYTRQVSAGLSDRKRRTIHDQLEILVGSPKRLWNDCFGHKNSIPKNLGWISAAVLSVSEFKATSKWLHVNSVNLGLLFTSIRACVVPPGTIVHPRESIDWLAVVRDCCDLRRMDCSETNSCRRRRKISAEGR